MKAIQDYVQADRIQMTEDEAAMLWPRINEFVRNNNRMPDKDSDDPLEKRMAEALIYIRRQKAERMARG